MHIILVVVIYAETAVFDGHKILKIEMVVKTIVFFIASMMITGKFEIYF